MRRVWEGNESKSFTCQCLQRGAWGVHALGRMGALLSWVDGDAPVNRSSIPLSSSLEHSRTHARLAQCPDSSIGRTTSRAPAMNAAR